MPYEIKASDSDHVRLMQRRIRAYLESGRISDSMAQALMAVARAGDSETCAAEGTAESEQPSAKVRDGM